MLAFYQTYEYFTVYFVFQISSLTVGCMESYESSVCKTCDAVDVNIKVKYFTINTFLNWNKSMLSDFFFLHQFNKIFNFFFFYYLIKIDLEFWHLKENTKSNYVLCISILCFI